MNKKIIIIIIILLLVLFGYVIINREKNSKVEEKNSNTQTLQQSKNSETGNSEEFMTYTHPNLGFTFDYPVYFSIGLQEESMGETLIIQKKSAGTVGQIYVSDFPANQKLTAELIAKEFPGKKIINGKKVLIGGVEAFSFESEEEGSGKTWEVMFTKGDKIYQAMCVLSNRPEFEAILTSWEF